MKKLFLILFLGIIVASCGRNQTEIPTEIVTETPTAEFSEQIEEEVAQTEITESSQNSSTTNESSEEKEYISGTWKRGVEPFFESLSFSSFGTYEYNVGTQGKGGIEYYVKGNTVYVDVYDNGNYEALMQITSNGDIIFHGATFKRQ
jgi:hypothetical protein